MDNTFLVITSIAGHDHHILRQYAEKSVRYGVPLLVVGDTKSPAEFYLEGCDYYSIERQKGLPFELAGVLPTGHYARKNLGYLAAMLKGAEVIIETDDDNEPLDEFWSERKEEVSAHLIKKKGWVNVYKYFTDAHVWPRGYALEHIHDETPLLERQVIVSCPMQQGNVDENPDVDAVYRLTAHLPIVFDRGCNIALGDGAFCSFNSQNTTWFKKAFALMYLPSYCNFRMTDIWRSFIAQRIGWTCGWSVLFHNSTARQLRNTHDLMKDFRDEMVGYTSSVQIYDSLIQLDLKEGSENISENMRRCYQKMIELGHIDQKEMILLDCWLKDVDSTIKK